MHTSPDPRVYIFLARGIFGCQFPFPTFCSGSLPLLPCCEAEICEAHLDMSFCRAHLCPQGSGPPATRPTSAGIILTRDQSSSHTSKSTWKLRGLRRDMVGRVPMWYLPWALIQLQQCPSCWSRFCWYDCSDMIQARSISFSQHKLNQMARGVFGVPSFLIS